METNLKTFDGGKSFLDDKASLEALIDKMPEDEQNLYRSYGALSLESAFPGRKLVVYTLISGRPSDIVVISFEDLRVDWESGPTVEVSDSRGKMTLMTIPKRYRPRDLFLHIPQSFTLKYKGRADPKTEVKFVSHYAVLIKTLSKEHLQVEGHTYAVAPNKFTERFPDVKIRF